MQNVVVLEFVQLGETGLSTDCTCTAFCNPMQPNIPETLKRAYQAH